MQTVVVVLLIMAIISLSIATVLELRARQTGKSKGAVLPVNLAVLLICVGSLAVNISRL